MERVRETQGEEELVGRSDDEFTFCRTLIRGQLYRAGVCLHTMNRAFSIDVAGRLTPICCAFCSLPGFSGLLLNKYGLRVPAHRRDLTRDVRVSITNSPRGIREGRGRYCTEQLGEIKKELPVQLFEAKVAEKNFYKFFFFKKRIPAAE